LKYVEFVFQDTDALNVLTEYPSCAIMVE